MKLLPLFKTANVKSFLCKGIFVIYLFVFIPVKAQKHPVANVVFNSIKLNDGLSQGMINSILQDRYGFMWFATKDGLNRYDGYNFKIFRHDPQDTTTIGDSYVSCLLEDAKGRLWAGTPSGCVDLFDDATGKFAHVLSTGQLNKNSSISSVIQIAEDKQGDIWVLGNDKILKLSEKQPGHFSIKETGLPYLAGGSYLYVTNNGEIYFNGISKNVIYYFDVGPDQWKELRPVNSGPEKTKKDHPFIPYQLAGNIDGTRLYAFCNDGIYTISKNDAPSRILEFEFNTYVNGLVASDGRLLFFFNSLVGVFDPVSHQLELLSSTDEMIKGELSLTNSIYQDRTNLIWIGSRGYGLLTLDMQARRFHHTDKNSIFHITEKDGRILVNNGGASYKVLDPATGSYVDTLPVNKGRLIYENFSEYYEPMLKSSDNKLWIADTKRLLHYDPLTKKTETFLLPVKQLNFMYGFVNAMTEDATGKIWLGTSEGLLSFDPRDHSWKEFRNEPGNSHSLSFNSIFSLCKDPAEPGKYLWIGTNGGGLNRFDLQTGEFTRYSVKDGLPNDVVYGVLHDDDKRIWMSTNKGLSRFDPAKNSFKNFEEKDGLQNNEFNHNAFLRASDGTLVFGGVTGFNYFNPKEITDNPVIPKIIITDLRIRNQSVDASTEKGPLSKAIYLTKSITLPYSDNMISFEFASSDFTAPGKNLYSYKLENFDNDWIRSGNIHTATYTNLDPGNYTFKVKGTNKDGIWNEEGTSIELTVLPPWYMTWWFRIAAVVALVAAGYLIYRYRINKALELVAIRNRIANDLHDEIGSNLSNISIFSNVAQQQTTATHQVSALLEKISQHTQVSMEAMNDIVWMINARNDRFENIMSRMRALASEVLESSGHDLHIDFDERLNEIKLGMDKRKNFYLIFKEAINNIAKYAGPADVWILMKMKDKNVQLIIKDNGIGFDANSSKKGNGLVNMRSRAGTLNGSLEITSKEGEGTTIELDFPV